MINALTMRQLAETRSLWRSLYGCNCQLVQTVTNTNGSYLFSTLFVYDNGQSTATATATATATTATATATTTPDSYLQSPFPIQLPLEILRRLE